MNLRKLLAMLAVFTLFVTVMTACGDDDTTASDDGATDSTDGSGGDCTPPTGTEILIGQVSAQTGGPAGGTLTLARDTLDAWVQHTNCNGGVAGHPVKVSQRDTRTDPAAGGTAVQELLDEGVVAMVGSADTTTMGQWQALVTEAGVPLIGGTVYNAADITLPGMYGVMTTVTQILYFEIFALKNAGATKVASLLCNNADVCLQARAGVLAAGEALGVEIVYDDVADNTPGTDYTAQCLAMKNSGADAVLPFVDNAGLATNCAQQGFEPIYGGSEVSIGLDDVAATPAFQGLSAPMSAFPYFQEFPTTAAYFDAIKTYHPEHAEGGDLYGQAHMASSHVWVAGETFKKAVENAAVAEDAVVTAEDVHRGLAMFNGETLSGLIPPRTYADYLADPTVPNPQNDCVFLYRINDGKYETTPAGELRYYCRSDIEAGNEAGIPVG